MIKYVESFISDMDDCIKVVSLKNEDIIMERELRQACEQNTCGHFGANWMCPPAVGEIDSLIEKIRTYGDGLLMQSVYSIEDSFDFEGMMTALEKHRASFVSLLQTIEEHVERESLLPLDAGYCAVCTDCTQKQNEPCRFPDKAIASVESHGMAVNATLGNVGLKYNNGPNTVSYVGIILGMK